MTPKSLEIKSKYNEFDLDNDGVVTDDEIAKSKEMIELELREEKVRGAKTDGLAGNKRYGRSHNSFVHASDTRQQSKRSV